MYYIPASVSTKGVILAGSQFDIFCHCFSNDEGALLALKNLVDWINEETPNIRAARKEKQIGVVYSGLHFHYDLFTRSEYDDMELIYIRRLGRTDLSRYNALIVPRESNQEVLFAEREKLVHFLERGGMIFTFGEVILPWLPGLSWKKVLPTVCLPEDADIQYKTGDVVTDNLVIEEEGHPLFEGITLDDLRWHYHGVFSPHPGQRVLLSDGRGNRVSLS